MEILYALLQYYGGYARRPDGSLLLFSSRAEAAEHARPDEVIIPMRLVEV